MHKSPALSKFYENCRRLFRPKNGLISNSEILASDFGPRGEKLAANYLHKQGFRVIARNERNTAGEIDLIAVERSNSQRTIVFVEVKTWQYPRKSGTPAEAVDANKQQMLSRAALVFLRSRRLLEYRVRFDVISVILQGENNAPEIRHIQNAFEAIGKFQMFS